MLLRKLLLPILICLPLLPQTPTGTVTGLVTDPASLAVPNASITITEKATARQVMLHTNELGLYAAINLLPGTYSVRATAPGFATTEAAEVAISAGGAVTVDVQLQVAPQREVISVSTTPLNVDVVRSTVDTVVSEREIANLPLSSRNFLDLAILAPGVTVGQATSLDPTKNFNYRAVGISGRRGAGTQILVDGINITDPVGGSTVTNLSADAVYEFQLTRSSPDVAAPMTGTGTVAVISKAGSNELHGRVFADYYSDSMAARPTFGPAAPDFSQTRAAIAIGGPAIKDRLFWFANWDQSFREDIALTNSVEWPQLNASGSLPSSARYLRGRLDWNATSAARIFYSFQHESNSQKSGTTSPIDNMNWSAVHTLGADVAGGRWTHTFRGGLVQYNNRLYTFEGAIPFQRLPGGDAFRLSVGRYFSGPYDLPQRTTERSVQASYANSFFTGRHSLRVGASVNRLAAAARIGGNLLSVAGDYSPAAIAAVNARGADAQDPLQYPLLSFTISARPYYAFLAGGLGLPHGAHRDTRTATYIADHIRIHRRFAVNLGLRWEYDTGYFANDPRISRDPAWERWLRGSSQRPRQPRGLFSPSFGFNYSPGSRTAIRGGFFLAREGNLISNLADAGDLPPAFGGVFFNQAFIAKPDGIPLDIDGRHASGSYRDLEGQPISRILDTLGRLYSGVTSLYDDLPYDPSGAKAFSLTRGTVGSTDAGRGIKLPYTMQFNAGVQHEVARGLVLTADYIHHRGVGVPRLVSNFERNLDSETLDSAAARAQVARVLAGGTVDEWIAANPARNISAFALASEAVWPGLTPDFVRALYAVGGFTTYRALQTSLRGTHSRVGPFRDVAYTFNYTLSRSEASAVANNPELLGDLMIRNNRNPNDRTSFGPTALDRTHQLTFVPIVGTPAGFRLGALFTFRTPPPVSLLIPSPGGALAGQNSIFGLDLDGDAIGDLLPGTGVADFGRKIKSFAGLNRVIDRFNTQYAGKLTPHGRALTAAGIITESQLQRLGAVVPAVARVPESNPWPFSNIWLVNARIDRPFTIERGWQARFSPYLVVNNVFNHAPANPYTSLNGLFGALNYDYANAPAGRQESDLKLLRGRSVGARLVQAGLRIDF